MDRKLYAEVIIEISHEKIDRPFEYAVPPGLAESIHMGDKVVVPFGRGNTPRGGYVIGLKDHTDFDPDRIKSVISVSSDGTGVEGSQIALAWWIRSHFGGTMIQALKTVIPIKKKMTIRTTRRVDRLISSEEMEAVIEECERRHQTARLRVLRALLAEPTLPYELVRDKLNVSSPTLKSLSDKGYIGITETEYYRNPVVRDDESAATHELSPTQLDIITTVTNDHFSGNPGKYLIHGITGSGKTEVYIGIARRMVDAGLQVIVLIPEISLTYQTLLRFYKRFGDRVSVVHSSMSAGARYDQYVRAMRGELDVIIGPRSALFTPFERLGAIIIDEEHESSYKSENVPRYSTRECAEYVSQSRGVSLILGSATPSVDAYYKASKGIYRLFRMDERLTGGSLPAVYVEDLREELKMGNRSIFSRRLQNLIADRLDKGEQIMLFINRRGVAGFVSCRSCGYVCRCPHCDVSLTEHKNGRMTCHYCGYSEPKPAVCPECGSGYVAGFRAGTEQIEADVKTMYPRARVLRMDADTTREQGSMENILRSFRDHEADVLVGTQMIVKGHDFPLVTLVGILAADMSLGVGDYRAAERTFQLLTQAAGRAGRGDRPGEVVIQTYQTGHYSIRASREHDYASFYREEMAYRTLALYPPVWHMLAILVVADTEDDGLRQADAYKDLIEKRLDQIAASGTDGTVRGYVLGPAPAMISRIRDKYRYVLYVKNPDMEILVSVKDVLEENMRENPNRHVLTFFDFDPLNSV